ncbi:hypothetical protein RSOL_461610 [Rhizoctonia solani AG-3 Rhs1AP]|uniref:Uncharacterized protein n=1 Tax=Rhizoctonia solani AG-3 Rhs1AP TaxID=1086054 RepID=X8JGN6_9AGAM|nr:hypothetical protein RSOL_461610 [Rhizoctonia solani AG-3 Rhs1AP]
MSSIFNIGNFTSAPATIIYDDDDHLIDVVMNLGSKGTYTFKTDIDPSGNLHPFAGQVFYKDLKAMVEGAETRYQLRTGGRYAVVTLGDQEQPNTAVVVSYNERIRPKKFDEGEGDWTLAQPKTRTSSPRVPLGRRPSSTAGEYFPGHEE